MNNLQFREFYRRRLPHIQVGGATYFVTFRLKDSLPVEAREKLSQESKEIKRLPKEKAEIEQRRRFENLDDYLDRALCGDAYLKNQQVADVVTEAIHYRDTKVYDLISFCVMPNHVHLIFTPLKKERIDFIA